MKKAEFNINDIVQTKIEYMHGFDNNVTPPKGLPRLTNLKIIEIDYIDNIETTGSKYSENYLYTCQSKTRTYQINQCFLEKG